MAESCSQFGCNLNDFADCDTLIQTPYAHLASGSSEHQLDPMKTAGNYLVSACNVGRDYRFLGLSALGDYNTDFVQCVKQEVPNVSASKATTLQDNRGQQLVEVIVQSLSSDPFGETLNDLGAPLANNVAECESCCNEGAALFQISGIVTTADCSVSGFLFC